MVGGWRAQGGRFVVAEERLGDRMGVVYAFWSSNVSRKVIRALSFVDVRGFGTVERRKCAADGLWKEYRLNSL